MFLAVRKGFIYTIAVYFYAFPFTFSRILHHFALHFAPKRTAFSIKTQCVLHQNALHLAAYCTSFR
ncbi:hypothetical protein HMPREF2955_00080 [Prevotella sp. HMSC073D09]|nr:hypothetical protein HMPREF2955_00080 [Prevotella sp. HMSC073D09]